VDESRRNQLADTWKDMRGLWPLLLPVLLLIPGMTGFPYPPAQGAYSDISVTHYPNALFLLRSLREWGIIPLWSSTILSGYPFAANPLSGLWYPPGWLALLFPLPLGFNVLAAFHLLWAGVGMYYLLKTEGLPQAAAMLGGLSFSCLPKLFAHYGSGHITLVYAVSWTPWLLLSAKRRQPSISSYRNGWLQEGFVLSLILLADVRWAAYAGLVWLAYGLYQPESRISLQTLARSFVHLMAQVGLALLLAAPMLIPMLEYSRLSTRAWLTVEESTILSLPIARLLGLVFPDFGGYFEWVVYPGVGILLLACIGFFNRQPASAKFWLAVSIFSMLFALGPAFPLNSAFGFLPGYSLLRVPSRWLFVSGLAFAAGSGYGFAWLLGSTKNAVALRRMRLLLFAFASLGIILAGSIWIVSERLPAGFAWGAAALLLSAVWFTFGLKPTKPPSLWISGVLFLCALDLVVINRTLVLMRPAEDVLAEGTEAAQYLKSKTGRFRVYSPSYSLPQQTAAWYGLEFASGVDPLQLTNYADFIHKASGVPNSGYSVTLPALGEIPEKSNSAYQPNPELLGWLNVAYVVAHYELKMDDLQFVNAVGETRIYQNLLVKPRAWVESVNDSPGSEDGNIQEFSWTPNRIELAAQGPGLLVLSEIAYPGWQVWVDGRREDLMVEHEVLRAVSLGSGDHQVAFQFHPTSVYIGIGLCLLGLGCLFGKAYVQQG